MVKHFGQMERKTATQRQIKHYFHYLDTTEDWVSLHFNLEHQQIQASEEAGHATQVYFRR